MLENTPPRHGYAATLPPHADALVLVHENPGITPEGVAARLGIGVHEGHSRINTLVRVGYVQNMNMDGGDFFRPSRAGRAAADEVIRADDEFWILAPRVAHIGPEELVELRAQRDRLVSGNPCPVPSCSGKRFVSPRIDLEWVCLTCGLLELCGAEALTAQFEMLRRTPR